MPAPKSRLVPKAEPYEPMEVAKKLYRKVSNACVKMPDRYSYILLTQTIELAGKAMDNVKMALSVESPLALCEVEFRHGCWVKARAMLKALSNRFDRFVEVPDVLRYNDPNTNRKKGLTINEIEEIADLVNYELYLIDESLERDKRRFKSIK